MNKNNQLIRIDKNIAYNILDFDKLDDGKLIKDILFYISYSYQSDLFGFGTLDPVKFSKTMSVAYSNLFRKHKHPFQFLGKTEKEKKELIKKEKQEGRLSPYRLWLSNLENALFILKSKTIMQHYSKEDENGTRSYKEINFKVIKEIEINIKKIKGQNKIVYKYKLDDAFKINLRKFFLNADLKTYISLKKPNLEGFFIALSNIIQTRNSSGHTMQFFKFAELCNLLKISEKVEAKEAKRIINTKVKRILPLLRNFYPGICFNWKKGDGQKYAYVPVFSWDFVKTEIKQAAEESVYTDIFRNILKQELLSYFRFQYFDDDILYSEFNEETRFCNWLISDKDKEIKISHYISIYGRYHKVGKRFNPEKKAKWFLQNLSKLKKTREILNYLNTHV